MRHSRGRGRSRAIAQPEIVSSILKDWPVPLREVNPDLPYRLDQIVMRCLQKERRNRYQAALDMAHDLEAVPDEVEVSVGPGTIPLKSSLPFWRQPMALAVMVAVALTVNLTTWFLKPEPKPPLRKFQWTVDELWTIMISPDGTMMAYSTENRLWIRELNQTDPREMDVLSGTLDGLLHWSPGSDYLVHQSEDELRRVHIQSGAVSTLCGISNTAGGAWRSDNTFVFSQLQGFYTVPVQGGHT